MSLFRRERIYASVELDRVALVRLGADRSAREQAVLPVSFDPEHPEAALQALAATLATPAWRGAPRRIVLSDRLVRYLVMERPEGVRSAAELRLACEARFQASFDRPAAEWRIDVDARAFARRFLVCAMPRRLLDGLSRTFGANGQLVSLRPYLVSELGRRARRLPVPCWFVAATRDCLTLAGLADDGCRVVRVLTAEQPSVAAIEDLVARETLLAGEVDSDAPVLVSGTVAGDLAASAMRRVDAPGWGTQNSSWAASYRLALSEQWA